LAGPEHPDTLTSAGNLANSLTCQGRYAEAEAIEREVLAVRRRVLGAEHPNTLTSASHLACSLSNQGRHAEAEQIEREVLELQKRVLGGEHPDMLATANNLAMTLSYQGKHAEAERIQQSVLASCKCILGPTHPTTLMIAASLESVREHIRSAPPTTVAEAATPATNGTERPVRGTHVLVQQLSAKPEHNVKRERVLSFDAITQYGVVMNEDQHIPVPELTVWLRIGNSKPYFAEVMRAMMCGICKRLTFMHDGSSASRAPMCNTCLRARNHIVVVDTVTRLRGYGVFATLSTDADVPEPHIDTEKCFAPSRCKRVVFAEHALVCEMGGRLDTCMNMLLRYSLEQVAFDSQRDQAPQQDQVLDLDIGSRVFLHGLETAAQYNGQEGMVVAVFADVGLLGVRLVLDGIEVKVAPANLSAHPRRGAPDGSSSCYIGTPYAVSVESDYELDGTTCRSAGYYINGVHPVFGPKEPNVKMYSGDQKRVWIEALSAIYDGDELVLDYGRSIEC
jgi:hypothetical protein